jgi:hypothetical protein
MSIRSFIRWSSMCSWVPMSKASMGLAQSLAGASFYLSWYHGREAWRAATPPLFIRYEEFFADPERGLTALASQLGIPASGDQIAAALANGGQSRFNRGVSGRVAEAFRRDRRAYAALVDLLSLYPSIDFSPIFTPLAGRQTDKRPLLA